MPDGNAVRLMSDYCCGFPLWDESGLVDSPADLGLSARLGQKLFAWQELFEQHFHWETGWDTEENARLYRDQAWELAKLLRRELDVQIVVDLWPVEDRAPGA